VKKKRKHEIAFLLIKNQIKEKGIKISPNFRREVGNEAKNIGITTEEAMEFMEGIVRELVDKTFANKPKKG